MDVQCEYCKLFNSKPHCNRCKVQLGSREHAPQKITCTLEEFIHNVQTENEEFEAYGVGDYMTIHTTTGIPLQMVLIDRDSDQKADGSTTKLTLGLFKFGMRFAMGNDNDETEKTYYLNSSGRRLAQSIYQLLPPILKENIVPVVKYYTPTNTVNDPLWLFSANEVLGSSVGVGVSGCRYEGFHNPELIKQIDQTWFRNASRDGRYYRLSGKIDVYECMPSYLGQLAVGFCL